MGLLRDVVLLLISVTLAQDGGAQGLGAAAEREKERRAKQKTSGTAKSYGDSDLGKAGAALANDPSGRPAVDAGAGSSGGAAEATAPASGATGKDESYWRARARSLRAAVADAEALLKEGERVAAAGAPRRTRDGNCLIGAFDPPNGGIGNCEELEAARPRYAQSMLISLRQRVERARQQLWDLEDEARKAGASPGWIR